MKHRYEVIVGNVGSICSGNSLRNAEKRYNEYVKISRSNAGRAGNEDVTLMRDGEPYREYMALNRNEVEA